MTRINKPFRAQRNDRDKHVGTLRLRYKKSGRNLHSLLFENIIMEITQPCLCVAKHGDLAIPAPDAREEVEGDGQGRLHASFGDRTGAQGRPRAPNPGGLICRLNHMCVARVYRMITPKCNGKWWQTSRHCSRNMRNRLF